MVQYRKQVAPGRGEKAQAACERRLHLVSSGVSSGEWLEPKEARRRQRKLPDIMGPNSYVEIRVSGGGNWSGLREAQAPSHATGLRFRLPRPESRSPPVLPFQSWV